MPRKKTEPPPLERREVREVVRGYVVHKVKALTEGHDELFERGLKLYSLVEEEMLGDVEDARERIKSLKGHPLFVTVRVLIMGRARRVLDAAVRLMADNRQIMAVLSERVAEEGIHSHGEAERLYREILVEEVPLERSLDNVDAIAESSELVHDLLRSNNFMYKALTREAYAFVRKVIIRNPRIRAEMDELWELLSDDPSELLQLARSIRRHGPSVIDEMYEEE